MKKKKWLSVVFYIILTLFTLIYIFPIFYIILSSLEQPGDVWKIGFSLDRLTLDNYRKVFVERDFMTYLNNTVITTIAATVLTVLVNTMCGYALAKFRFKGDKLFFTIVLSTLMVPLVLIMSPVFMVLRKVGLYNSLWALIIPPAATPTGIFIMRQYLLAVPDELLEAARIDGASELGIFARIIVPIAKPVIATLTIFSIMWRWNDYIWPLIAISSPDKYTMQVALSLFVGENTIDWPGLLAMSTVSMLPLLIVFMFFQRYFIQGIAATGTKG